MEVDGFYVWEPNHDFRGYLGPHHLRAIADELDRLNAPWEQRIEDYFNKEEVKEICKA